MFLGNWAPYWTPYGLPGGGQAVGRRAPPGHISADFRPIPTANKILKFQKYGFFWYFGANLSTFFFEIQFWSKIDQK